MTGCRIEDCDSDVIGRQLCRKHYYRWYRTGTTDLLPRRKKCTVEGCDDWVHGQGLCAKHWARNQRHGDPTVRLRQRDPGPPETRWMAKVSVESPGCWIWTAGKSEGYGAYEKTRAHQYVWTLLVGPVPEGMELDHLCQRRACCNPDHLEPVPHRVNTDRGPHGKGKPRPKRQGPPKRSTSEEQRAKRAAYARDYYRRKRAADIEGARATQAERTRRYRAKKRAAERT